MNDKNFERQLLRLYWLSRQGMALIWGWTAYVSWFDYPQALSLAWLQRIGITQHAALILAAACLFDLLMGLASAACASRLLWQAQIVCVLAYSLVIALGLPEFLIHPFGPISKNIAVLCCLGYLSIMEAHRSA